jgi:hypothetical protein
MPAHWSNLLTFPSINRLCAGFALATVVAGATLGGCSVRPVIGRAVAINGLIPVESPQGKDMVYTGPLRVDIDNELGSVELRVNPKLLAPTVRAAVYVEKAQEFAPGWVAAQIVDQGDGPAALQIVATPPQGTKLPVRLIVTVPKIAGLTINNNGGPVRATDLVGPVDVFNGLGTMKGGDTFVELAQASVAPVRVRSTTGNVFVSLASGSGGRVAVRGERQAVIEDRAGTLTGMARDRYGTRGVLSQLDIDHEVRADNGSVTLQVREAD